MMGRSHVLCGLTVGVYAASLLGDAPWPVRLLLIPVCGGAALLPDLDHPSGTAARSLGFVTRWVARRINDVSLAIYHATRCEGDRPSRRDGHRTATHTIPGCLVFGIPDLVLHGVGETLLGSLGVDPAWSARIPGIWTALGLGVCLGLLARTSPRIGTLFTVGGSLAGYWVILAGPGWWWVWPAVVALGCLTHLAGDVVTVSGIPLLWPLVLQGSRGAERWRMIATPVAFHAGRATETSLVVPVLVGGLVVSVGVTTGILPAVVSALWRVTAGA